MGARPLNAKRIRRFSQATGLDVIYAVGYGGYWHDFVTSDHRHGIFNVSKFGSHRRWEWDVRPWENSNRCFTVCAQLFPGIPWKQGNPADEPPYPPVPEPKLGPSCSPPPTQEQADTVELLFQTMKAMAEVAIRRGR
jgi:hypothetical protein